MYMYIVYLAKSTLMRVLLIWSRYKSQQALLSPSQFDDTPVQLLLVMLVYSVHVHAYIRGREPERVGGRVNDSIQHSVPFVMKTSQVHVHLHCVHTYTCTCTHLRKKPDEDRLSWSKDATWQVVTCYEEQGFG